MSGTLPCTTFLTIVRACFWPGAQTSREDRERWFGGVNAKLVVAVESAWLGRIRAAKLYRYLMPEGTLEELRPSDASGHWVSREVVRPLGVEPVGDLLSALAGAGVELRITTRLVELWNRVVQSTLEYSGTRMRNAQSWPSTTGPR